MRERQSTATLEVTCHPATSDRWKDLEELFGPRGACAGCWCMSWRLPRAVFNANKGKKNKAALRKLLEGPVAPGILAYVDGRPVGWCAVAPRTSFPVLANSRIFSPIDDQPVWSVTCFFVARPYRRKGVSGALLRAAVEYARSQGATTIEAYPNDLDSSLPDAFVWTGLLPTFRRAGFKVVARRSAKRPVVRL